MEVYIKVVHLTSSTRRNLLGGPRRTLVLRNPSQVPFHPIAPLPLVRHHHLQKKTKSSMVLLPTASTSSPSTMVGTTTSMTFVGRSTSYQQRSREIKKKLISCACDSTANADKRRIRQSFLEILQDFSRCPLLLHSGRRSQWRLGKTEPESD